MRYTLTATLLTLAMATTLAQTAAAQTGSHGRANQPCGRVLGRSTARSECNSLWPRRNRLSRGVPALPNDPVHPPMPRLKLLSSLFTPQIW
jgi:hypothetical protein